MSITRAAPDPRRTPSAAGDPVLAHAPTAALAAELDMLYRALQRTRVAEDARAEAAALRCIAAVEDELLARDECL